MTFNPGGSANLGNAMGRVLLNAEGVRQGMREAQDAARSGMQNIRDSIAGSMQRVGGQMQSVGSQLSLAFAPVTVAVGQGLRSFANFDAALNEIEVRTRATAEQMELVRATAMQMGRDTEFSATQAASGLLELLASGSSLEEAIATLPHVLNLASAGALDLGFSADAVTDILAQFQLGTESAEAVTNALAQAAGSSSATVDDLIQGFANVGPVARSFGLSVDDTAAVLAVFAENGIKGSEAGTQLKSMLNQMSRPTKEVQETWDALGVSMFDAQGQMRPLQDVITDLDAAMADMSDQERIETVRALAGSYGQMGLEALLASDGLAGMQAQMDEATTAAEQAAGRTNAFIRTVAQLRSSMETLMITVLGPLVETHLKPAIIAVTDLLNRFNDWLMANPELAAQLGELLAIMAVIGPVIFSAGKAISLAGAAFAAILSPVGLLTVAIAALYIAWRNNLFDIRGVAQQAFSFVMAIMAEFEDEWRAIVAAFNHEAKMVETIIKGAIIPSFRLIWLLFKDGKLTFDNFVWAFEMMFINMISTIQRFHPELAGILTPLRNAVRPIGNLLRQVWTAVEPLVDKLGGLETVLRIVAGSFLSVLFPPLGMALQLFNAFKVASAVAEDGTGVWIERIKELGETLLVLGEDVALTVLELLLEFGEELLEWGEDQADALVEQLAEWGVAFVAWVPDAARDLVRDLAELGLKVVRWISEQAPKFLVKLLEWSTAFYEWLGPVLVETLPLLGEWLGTIIEWLIGEGLPWVIKTTAMLGAAFVKWIIDAAPMVAPALWEYLKAIADFMVTHFVPAMLEFGANLIEGLWRGLNRAFDNLFPGVRELFEMIISFVKALFGISSPSTVMIEIGEQIVQGLVQGITQTWQQMFEQVRGVFNSLIDWLDQIKMDVEERARGLVAAFVQEILVKWGELSQSARDRFDEILAWLSDIRDNVAELAINIVTNFVNGIVETWDDLREDWESSLQEFVDAVTGLADTVYNEALNIGGDLVAGIQQGITNAWSGFTSFLNQKANAIPNAFRGVLGISSPSLVMMGIGRDVVGGLRMGMEQQMPALQMTVNSMAGSISGAVSQAAGQIRSLQGLSAQASRLAASIGGAQRGISAMAGSAVASGGGFGSAISNVTNYINVPVQSVAGSSNPSYVGQQTAQSLAQRLGSLGIG